MGDSYDHTSSSSVITIRVPDFIKQELSNISESNHLTLNANIAKILTQYIEWEQFVGDSGFVYTNKVFLKQLFKSVDEKEIRRIAKDYCVESLKTSVLYIHGEITNNTLIKTIEGWFRTSHIPFRHIEKHGTTNYIAQHGLGKKWSLYIFTVIETIAHEIGYAVEGQQEQNSVSFTIKKQT
ncbi:MAG: hypothetical protein K5793_08755 [Nitrosarchaeum sp.]|nr:hypothetical protein [Nitrosarchaeum sp.]MCV0398414.1 hypothetical protein [Nitrosarchaeum sp.]